MMIRSILAIAMGLSLTGCVTSTTPRAKPVAPVVGRGSVEDAVASDPCATRVHEIAGAMLQYYAIDRQLPAKLEDLNMFKDDAALVFRCPTSNLPYVYVPSGLAAPGGSKIIILHDAAPTHNGRRWCLLMAPSGANAAQSMEVLSIPEQTFRAYLPLLAN